MKEKRSINAIYEPQLTGEEIANRKKLIDWMCDMGDTLKVSAETIHKAVGYFDHIICENNLKEKELQSIALVCILLAGKLTERDPEVTRIASQFRKSMCNPRINIRQYEAQIMDHLDWDLQRITAMEFTNFFISQGIAFTSDSVNSSAPNEETAKSLRQYAEFFSDLCLQEYEFISTDSLVLASGVIAAARKMLKFKEVWRKELELLTTVEAGRAEECAAVILSRYEKLFPRTQRKARQKNEDTENIYPIAKSSSTHSIKKHI
eukprot:TRINITY_DN12262_c0_g5_i2.p1 TRINITY_DN12262_c0_g5~~TRINITY_DN12262_c0_g5_i2.p1  ORF type:complete len:263 (+),score=78.85 TRINITY_DN12262_c0_g5_i2:339-1127(+)